MLRILIVSAIKDSEVFPIFFGKPKTQRTFWRLLCFKVYGLGTRGAIGSSRYINPAENRNTFIPKSNMLHQQFAIPIERAAEVAQGILDVYLVCSLGGQYKTIELPSGRSVWVSDAWPSFDARVLQR